MPKYTLIDLDYRYDALEPYIDELTMVTHHTKHHQGYVNNLNAALEKYPDNPYASLEELLLNLDKLPAAIQTQIRNHGGGTYNHNLFFTSLSKNDGTLPQGKLMEAILHDFGSFEAFKTQFTQQASGRFGSGWAWLIVNKNNKLEVTSTPNQDTPLALGKPILGIDVWEHAYYLKYQNWRPEYIDNFFQVIDWTIVEKRYLDA
ncbi:MAG: superoxide dismutase [Candidatus Izemoplasmatales bacterium]|jgi:Fe-Mn family superoxide dismutase